MFRKLRNHFILINLLTTSIILIGAYSTIYAVAKSSSSSRKPIPPEMSIEFSETTPDTNSGQQDETHFREVIEERVIADRQQTMSNLLKILIITGVSVEILVAVFSYFFAEEAIKPVKTAYESQKIFIANASHEIKTPIAAIKANLEAADLSAENHWIKNIELEADKAERLTLDLLRLARTDITPASSSREATMLKTYTKDIIDAFNPRFVQRHLKLTTSYQVPASLSTPLNRADYKELLEILLDNACKYAHTQIRITLTSKSFTIQNDGATISAEQLPHIFDRFYQTDKSASGSGLGLAIAKSLAERNSWKLHAASDTKTTTFTLDFS